jgi:hypothetical protein
LKNGRPNDFYAALSDLSSILGQKRLPKLFKQLQREVHQYSQMSADETFD